MTDITQILRYAHTPFPVSLKRPPAHLQPILAREGKPNIDVQGLKQILQGDAIVEDQIPVRSFEHWESLVRGLDPSFDAILPVSIAAYPTEVWNSHPGEIGRASCRERV